MNMLCYFSCHSLYILQEVRNIYVSYFFFPFRIYIPSGILSFHLSIWNCSFMLHNFRDIHKPCIEAMYLKGRVLPTSNHFHPMESKTLTTNASYSFIESSPYEDSYYYLSIVSSSIIEFNVKVDITGNP